MGSPTWSKYDEIVDEIYRKILDHGVYRKSWLLNDYPEHANRMNYIISMLLKRHGDVKIVRIRVLSTRNSITKVLDNRFRGEAILYLAGYERAAASNIVMMLRKLSISYRSLYAVLRRNRVPEDVIREAVAMISTARKKI